MDYEQKLFKLKVAVILTTIGVILVVVSHIFSLKKTGLVGLTLCLVGSAYFVVLLRGELQPDPMY